MDVYFFSGLGADKTVFQFLDLSFCNPVFIEWITPLKKETLEGYAIRLKEHYQIPDNAFIAGLSFGGMLATELAKYYPALQVILISSAKTKDELPRFYQAGKYISMHNWTPAALQRWFMLNMKMLFGLKTPVCIKVYEALIKRSDTNFNRWAVSALLHWENTIIPSNIKHIHGTHDKIIPYKYVTCNYTVKEGGHLMVMEQAVDTSKFINDIIREWAKLSSSASQPGRLLPG